MADRERLRELAKKASPLPWSWYRGYDSLAFPRPTGGTLGDGTVVDYGPEDFLVANDGVPAVYGVWRNDGMADCSASDDNAAYITAACSAIPELLDEIERLEDELRDLRIQHARCVRI